MGGSASSFSPVGRGILAGGALGGVGGASLGGLYGSTPGGRSLFGTPGGGAGPGDGGFGSAIQPFRQALGEFNPQIQGIAQDLIAQGLGTEVDPLVQAQRSRALDQANAQLARTGITGSVAMNQLGRINAGYDEMAQARKGQLLQGGLGLGQSALQNLLAEPALTTSQLAAQNAGQGGGGGKK